MSGWLDTYVSGDQFGSDYQFVHVATLRISEMGKCGSYGNVMGVCNRREKGLMSGEQPLQSMGQVLSVGSVSVVVAEWSHVYGVL